MKIFFYTCVALGLVMVSSCCFINNEEHAVGYRNIGTKNIVFVYDTYWGQTPLYCGILGPGIEAISHDFYAIPESAKIGWKRADGKIVERVIKVKEKIPKRFSANHCIMININDNDEFLLSFERWPLPEIDSDGKEVHYAQDAQRLRAQAGKPR